MRRRVVVTGIGCITPVGNTVDEMWESLSEGKSGVSEITHFDASNFPTQFAAEVRNLDFLENVPDELMEQQQIAGRNSGFMIAAGLQAWTHAGLPTVTLLAGNTTSGLPMGLQIAAGWHQDELLLAWAAALEKELDA